MNDSRAVLASLSRVVLVDDNAPDNEYATIMLRRAGYTGRVDVHTSGEDALAAFPSDDPRVDLLLLDINMPGMNGFEFARALGTLIGGSAPPVVVMLTSSPDPRELERAAAVQVIRGLTIKPLSVPVIHEIVDRLLSPGGAARVSGTPGPGAAPRPRGLIVID